MHDYDVLIIGGGQAGVPLAHALRKAGRRTALAERAHLGGSCVNFGCTPTKAVLESVRLAHRARGAADYGLRIPEVSVDFSAVMARARDLSRSFREGLEAGFDGPEAPDLLRGHARFEGRSGDGFRLRVGDRRVSARRVVLNTGTRSRRPDLPGLDTVPYVHAGNWLDLDALPEHVVLVGGGYIGLEMAQFFRRAGGRVTVVERGDEVLGREDADVAGAVREMLADEGATFHLATSVERVEGGAPIRLHLDGPDAPGVLEASHLFVGVGRVPNTDDLGLRAVGVETDDEGFVRVDERLATSADGIYALGDVRGGPMFTHTAWDDFRIVRDVLLGDGRRTTDRIVPYVVHTDPALGRVGLSEADARAAGHDVRTARLEMETNGRAQERGEERGFVKVVVDARTDRLLGAAVFAAEGGELIHPYVVLMNADAPWTVLYDGVFAHPTLSEAVHSVFGELA